MDKQEIKKQIEDEMALWQTKKDEIMVQIHLAKKEVQEKAQPQLDQLDSELKQADEQLKKFQSASESAWEEIHSGIRLSFKAMEQAVSRAKEHFEEKEA